MYPDLSTFLEISKTARMVPLSEEFDMDTQTPIGIFMRFARMENSFLLESVEGGERWARYSHIGRRPFLIFKSSGENMTVIENGRRESKKGDPFEELKRLRSEYKGVRFKGAPRFCGGAVGYIGYDMARRIENLPGAPRDDIGLPECYLGFYDEIITYDHLKQRVIITVNAKTHGEGDARDSYRRAEERIENTRQEIMSAFVPPAAEAAPRAAGMEMESTFTREEFLAAVKKAKEYIVDGDIFQVQLSRRLSVKTDADPFGVYRALRTLNPSPYLYYLKFEDTVIVGSSPELMVRVEDGTVETCPIAGTCRRGADEAEDEELAKRLLADEKERAEHTMLIDLGRNDIGKVSEFGSVKVINPMHIEKYSHVMHLVTNVAGKMKEGLDCIDALRAVLPAGTLTGAPKVRAMQIIDELEPVKRGCYGGCVGYMGFDGNLDTCITIRTVIFHKGRAYIQAAAGIVADSVPEKEFEETLNKGQALFLAIEKAGR